VTVRLNCPLPIRLVTALSGLCHDDRATQIAEFAISLPLLVVFVVGIFDFSGALTLKQKLTNAARDAARVAAADPSNDLAGPPTSGVPVSVSDAFQVVDNYLLSENINDCGLKTAVPIQTAGTLTWTSTPASCPSVAPFSGVILTINRGFVTAQTIGGNATDVVNTQVTIQYAYKWRFNSVITLLVPSASYASVSYITTTATAYNEN
jgi:Flp pilus assembly protein TadG